MPTRQKYDNTPWNLGVYLYSHQHSAVTLALEVCSLVDWFYLFNKSVLL